MEEARLLFVRNPTSIQTQSRSRSRPKLLSNGERIVALAHLMSHADLVVAIRTIIYTPQISLEPSTKR